MARPTTPARVPVRNRSGTIRVHGGGERRVRIIRQQRTTRSEGTPRNAVLTDRFTVHPVRVDRGVVADEVVGGQAGGFHSGWITDDVVGPFEGKKGTLGW